ncbi:MAG TPA: hypothetical protein VL523_12100 [Terriglobia bacterium]|nr:hypothetical protein [Terriglobia bacterium]
MPLRRSSTLTPASLAARRANALKSTGPRSARGKACVSFNALKHGRYAARAPLLRQRLLAAGYRREEDVYGRIRSRIAQTFGGVDPHSRRQADRLAAWVWCSHGRLGRSGTKLESPLESGVNRPWTPGHTRICLTDPYRRLGLVFWLQGRRGLAGRQLERVAQGLEPLQPSGPGCFLEEGLRIRLHRLAQPGMEERLRYGLDRYGDYHPELVADGRRTLKRLGGSYRLGPIGEPPGEAKGES